MLKIKLHLQINRRLFPEQKSSDRDYVLKIRMSKKPMNAYNLDQCIQNLIFPKVIKQHISPLFTPVRWNACVRVYVKLKFDGLCLVQSKFSAQLTLQRNFQTQRWKHWVNWNFTQDVRRRTIMFCIHSNIGMFQRISLQTRKTVYIVVKSRPIQGLFT